MVVIPSVIGVAINQITKGKVNKNVAPCLKPFSKIGLLFVIMINTSQVSDALIKDASWRYVPIVLLCVALASAGFPIVYHFCKLFRFSHENARNTNGSGHFLLVPSKSGAYPLSDHGISGLSIGF